MNTNFEGFNVYELVDLTGNPGKGDIWQIRKGGISIFEGKFRSVVLYAANSLGINLSDVEKAIQSVVYNAHDVLTFDRNGNLMHTSKRMQKTG